mmetsp:Transcript_18316/g.22717  ORF Transcript_18316/g.22717 Transcript_18316/m.22717 type:complete len:517 (+) Transcript_18316:109-1659(+)|eukprot:CAMPEP_0172511220 /NCGR_PEP_ID=MMETSP1066-20121228/234738_1 /TAXON_ID=671091 /ORGANISM="Coscinodiscus wailesii, Strain CCMP2513" /LENGTH=516 /DNA_ID=CAMNT_0013290511 /DNA_START=94 /DNA_END=1644 /DNA_ORIENTATION=+
MSDIETPNPYKPQSIKKGLSSRPTLRPGISSKQKQEEGIFREQVVEIRDEGETKPMGFISRRKVEFLNLVRGDSSRNLSEALGEDDMDGTMTPKRKQFIIKSRVEEVSGGCFSYLNYFSIKTEFISNYLYWTFTTSFFTLIFAFLFKFLVMNLLFTGLIMLVGTFESDCMSQYDGAGAPGFNDAFMLSWTTFSTVGYGNIYPQTGTAVADQSTGYIQGQCGAFSFLMSMEAFIGILYAGFCGAILFGKILRIQSTARVIFSDPILVRYGSGVTKDDGSDEEEQNPHHIPCPVMEFRVINAMSQKAGSELLDATLNVVAILDAQMVRKSKVSRNTINPLAMLVPTTRKSRAGNSASGIRLSSLFSSHSTHDEDPESQFSQKSVFSKLEIESPEHPFFRRVWTARHVLNENSPLLSPYTRKAIKLNDGFWPNHLNDYKSIRNEISFKQVAVSLSGVSNWSASSVYANKIYDYLDVNIGYQFASVLYKDENDMTLVDTNLIDDVFEQDGGGGEPLVARD